MVASVAKAMRNVKLFTDKLLVFVDRIYGIDWIYVWYFPFPDEREKDHPPVAEGIRASLIMFIMLIVSNILSVLALYFDTRRAKVDQ